MPDSKEPYIECSNISKHYSIQLNLKESFKSIISNKRYTKEGYYALKDISFKLHRGDRLGIIGANGAGKSTLLKIISGVIKPSSGSIRLQGESTAILEAQNILYEDLSGRDNIKIVTQLIGISNKINDDELNFIQEFSELGPYIDQPIKYYSSGMKLRLTMAIYQFIQPDILLMDEVMAVGDVSFRNKLIASFNDSFSKIPVIIMVSHEVNDIVNLCNKCLYLKDGEMVFLGDVSDVYKKYSIEHLEKKSKQSIKNGLKIISHNQHQIKKHSEKILFSFTLEISEPLNCSIVFYLNDTRGPVLFDSLLFREKNEYQFAQGVHEVQISIHSYLLNKGTYFAKCIFANPQDDNHIEQEINLGEVKVISDDWEKDEKWNIHPKYPLRPQLEWKIESIKQQ
ncbi:MAG: ATP-binding cassette domain-containing protein [Chitinophagales bacterium]|nr:ATP-binding cassette domain-containing protein [Chitinophagales bacterium]